MKELSFIVPLVPPSVNHYKNKDGRSGRWYVTREALAFKSALSTFHALSTDADDRQVDAKEYELSVIVFLAKGQKGDGDNFFKVIADGLKESGAIRSDAAIKRWIMEVARDVADPRTVITVREYVKGYAINSK